MEEQFGQQGKLLQELRTQLRFIVRDEAAERRSAFPETVETVADEDAKAAVSGFCLGDEKDLGNEEEPPSWDPCWDPEMRKKLKEHQSNAKRTARRLGQR